MSTYPYRIHFKRADEPSATCRTVKSLYMPLAVTTDPKRVTCLLCLKDLEKRPPEANYERLPDWRETWAQT